MVIPGAFTFDICRILHERGINARYMGIVFKQCKYSESRTLLLIEMAARVIKQTLREKIRERMSDLKFPLETPYIELLTAYINKILFEADEEAWRQIENNILSYFDLKADVKQKSESVREIINAGTIKDLIWSFTVRDTQRAVNETYPGYLLLFDRIQKMIGFKVNRTFLKLIYNRTAKQLQPLSINRMGQKIKHMNIISHAEGWLLKNVDPETALRKFDKARSSLPLNRYTLRNYASTYLKVVEKYAEQSGIPHDSEIVFYIKYLFNLALEEDPDDTHTLYQFGQALNKAGQYADALEYLVRSVEIQNEHKQAWDEIVVSLAKLSIESSKYTEIINAKFINE
jgi:tetratricopeptide (TPR) repeat protein